MTNLLNIILDFFGICPISYRIELSCLYIHKGIIALVLGGYEVQMYMKTHYFERKSTFKI